MAPRPVFTDATLQRRYEECGYVAFPLLDEGRVREIRESYARLVLEDPYGIGYKVSLYSAALDTRRRARDFLIEAAFPALEPMLANRTPYMATYLVKEPGGRSIPTHQDWTHCDETHDDSVMCWIPLSDVDERNGGLGFVDGSHRWFDYARAFPYMVAQTPIDRCGPQLVAHLRFLPMRAGDVVVFNNRVVHGSLPNHGQDPRIAFSFALHPSDTPLLGYYLKPQSGAKVLLRYQATPEFYLEYPNPRLGELYQRHEHVPGYSFEEIPYDVPPATWSDLEERLRAHV
jgi:hypothetical protein